MVITGGNKDPMPSTSSMATRHALEFASLNSQVTPPTTQDSAQNGVPWPVWGNSTSGSSTAWPSGCGNSTNRYPTTKSTSLRSAVAQEPDFQLDPVINWDLLAVVSDTDFPVPCEGKVHSIAAGLLARLPFLQKCDLHNTIFVLQMTTMWSDIDNEDRKRISQCLNVYNIVAQVTGLPP